MNDCGPGTGVNGVPAQADFHIDLVNPFVQGTAIPAPENATAHGVVDVIPDLLRARQVRSLLEINCASEGDLNEATRSDDWGCRSGFRRSSTSDLLCRVHFSQKWGGRDFPSAPQQLCAKSPDGFSCGLALACVGILVDSRRRFSILALALFLPALMLIGVLDGHF